ncbi:type 1 glutamine amidotransferase domain-containing protein [Lysinibacillus xylanilyticus]|uniref:type 1 glutamine amidotransferase domain-containing protein n=1 Tax=Lysinibacillus xylanilyticus TaxID=582475 RepID=UPI00083CA470|nr:type 1 glutamine amidotransferase domain-containing protein [Lysinibacillus xylanilyticus]
MKKILVVLTNITRYANTTEATGLWIGEATEFVEEVTKSGLEVDYVSPKGGFVPVDPRSMKYADESTFSIYESEDFQNRALRNSMHPSEVNPNDYIAIYYTGGHGVMWDFPNNPELQQISLTIYNNGGYIASVCHGIAGLLNIKDKNGDYLIRNKKITGFTTTEEILSTKKSIVPFLNKDIAIKHGAIFQKARAFRSFVVQDGNLITGQNPFSTREVAKKLLTNL